MKRNSAFTLVELVVVLGIALVMMGLAANSFTKIVADRRFENAVNTFYSTVYDQLLQTVLVQNRSAVVVMNTSLSGAYGLYTENSLETPMMELRPFTGSYLTPNVTVSFMVKNNLTTMSGGTLLKQDVFEKTSNPIIWGVDNIVVPTAPNFLVVDEKKLPATEFFIADASGIVKSGKLVFAYFGGGEVYGKALLNRLEGHDYRNNVILVDTLEIHYSPKGKKTFVGYKGGVEYELKSVRVVFVSQGASSLYIDLN